MLGLRCGLGFLPSSFGNSGGFERSVSEGGRMKMVGSTKKGFKVLMMTR